PANGVLDAEVVVIVRRTPVEKAGWFRIDEVFLGHKNKGDLIDLGDFELSIVQESGPPVVEPITDETRILLFLQPKKDCPGQWEPTDFKESFFWVQRRQE